MLTCWHFFYCLNVSKLFVHLKPFFNYLFTIYQLILYALYIGKYAVSVSALYTATKNNEVICYGTNMDSFHKKLKLLEPLAKSQSYYLKLFKQERVTHFANAKREIVVIQKLR